MLAPPSDDGGHRLLLLLGRSRRDGQFRRHDHLGRRHRGGAIAIGQAADVVRSAGVAAEINPAVADRGTTPCPSRGPRHSCAPRRRPSRAPRPPMTVRSIPHRPRAGPAPAGPPPRLPVPPPDGPRRATHPRPEGGPLRRSPARCTTIPSNPSSATSRLRSRANEAGGASNSGRVLPPGPAHLVQVVRTVDVERRGLPARRRRRWSAVPGACPAWPDRPTRRPGRATRCPLSPPAHHDGDSSSSSGSVVRSPAPSVMQRSPGRNSARTAWCSSSQPAT